MITSPESHNATIKCHKMNDLDSLSYMIRTNNSIQMNKNAL